MGNWNDRLFLLINASDHPAAAVVTAANVVAADVIFLVAMLFVALWVWGKPERRDRLVAAACATALALAANQALGLLWYEPRPFMIGLGHTFADHAVENSFPSDHATFMFTAGLSLIITGAARRWGILVTLRPNRVLSSSLELCWSSLQRPLNRQAWRRRARQPLPAPRQDAP